MPGCSSCWDAHANPTLGLFATDPWPGTSTHGVNPQPGDSYITSTVRPLDGHQDAMPRRFESVKRDRMYCTSTTLRLPTRPGGAGGVSQVEPKHGMAPFFSHHPKKRNTPKLIKNAWCQQKSGNSQAKQPWFRLGGC
jgi:hypothetical protein